MKIHAQPSSRTVALAVSVLLAASFTSTLTAQENQNRNASREEIHPGPGRRGRCSNSVAGRGGGHQIDSRGSGRGDHPKLRGALQGHPYALTADDLIALKEKQVPDDVTAAMLLRGQQANRPKTGRQTPHWSSSSRRKVKWTPKSYEILSESLSLSPCALQLLQDARAPLRRNTSAAEATAPVRYGNRGPSRFGSTGPARNDRRGRPLPRGGRFGR